MGFWDVIGTVGANLVGNLAGSAVQNKMDVDNWMKQQEYNSPANQMKRYKEAGLNPLLIYGQGNNGNAGTAPPSMDVRSATKDLGTLVQDINMKNQTIDNLKLEAENKDLQNQLLEQENYWKSLLSGVKYDQGIADISKKQVETTWIPQMREADIAKKTQDIIKSKADVKLATERNPALISVYRSQAVKNAQDTALSLQRTIAEKTKNQVLMRQLTQQIELVKSRIANIDQATASSHQLELLNQVNARLRDIQTSSYDGNQISGMLTRILSLLK